MADGPALALQSAVIARLKVDAGVRALVGERVYDEPPQAVVFPYLRLGNVEVSPLRMDGYRDFTVTFSVEAHSRPASGRVEATRLAEAVATALDDTALAVAGFSTDWCWFLTQAVTRAGDGRTYLATVAFEASLAP